ncbi:single-stranded DNA-binding protein [Subtercola boreus]|uniref:single-stranded DNA-binding protein n=1 Tax=Subtercola boreus TaxID=120213 RepID=UPI001C0EE620|nr:single-stranded DNA-binding protein [Subtercola boreus]
MPDTICLTGVVATTPRHITTTEGLDITSFRLASSQRRFDRHQNSWVDVGTNWYTLTAFRQLASNLATSVSKGDRVVAAGRLRIREWENAEKSGMTVEIEVESVGHDLGWGTTQFSRTVQPEAQAGVSSAPPGAGPGGGHGMPPGPGDLGPGSGDVTAPAVTGSGGWAIPGARSEPAAGLGSDGFTPASTADSEHGALTPHLDSTRL